MQRKAKFLCRFIPNYAELTKGFTRLLKKGYNFVWDDTANKDFESLKLALTRTPLLFPPDYSRDYFLYLPSSESTIVMVLVQVEYGIEHLIYYFSYNLNDTELKCSYVEKLALDTVQAI